MAALPVVSVSVRVVCGAEELKVSGSRYLSEGPDKRFKSNDNLETTIETFMRKYNGTPIQFSLTKADPPAPGSSLVEAVPVSGDVWRG